MDNLEKHRERGDRDNYDRGARERYDRAGSRYDRGDRRGYR